MKQRIVATTCLLLASWCDAQAPAPERRNWFDDPFFQVSAGIPGCVPPLGPFLTEDEERREAHDRVERGTSCWLAGKCRESNAYRYDKSLASPVKAALLAVPGLERSSVWVTIQRRWVFLQGCIAAPAQSAQLERAARAVPEVEAVLPQLSVGVSERPPYRTRQ